MSEKDHLDKDITFSGQITETGVKASVRSRLASGIDRLCGSVADLGASYFEGISERRRAQTEGEVALIKQVAKLGIERLSCDESLQDRAIAQHYNKVLRAQANKDAVVREAIIELKEQSEQPDEHSGPDVLSEEFLDRFEKMAGDASTADLQHRWGRVLAGEIRRPGTFSRKVMRAVDELDSYVAKLFEEVSSAGIGSCLILGCLREIHYSERLKLANFGLTVDHTEQIRKFTKISNGIGPDLWVVTFGDYAIGFNANCVPDYSNSRVLVKFDDIPCLPIFLLTESGEALLTVIARDEIAILRRAADLIETVLGGEKIVALKLDPVSNMLGMVQDF
ncbi:DUF2806 domain-containing protein [Brucella pseudogrignonensis]|uniref:DUF2806 domain-containing protein n=1 Tax=Brucella pseudogrignonensis TaxID=419475 RepID=UPI003ECDE6F4